MPRPRARALAALVATALVLAGCAARHDRDAEAAVAHHRVAIASWDGADILPAAGRMARYGRIGVYYAVDGDRYSLAAIDVTTGAELGRRVVHQMARRQDEVQEPTIDVRAGLVYADVYDEATATPGLVALDLRSGRPQWRTTIDVPRDTPILCGRSSLCVTTARYGVMVFDRATGRRRTVPSGGLWLEIARTGDYLLSADPDRRRVELGRSDDRGYHRMWSASFNDLYGPAGSSNTTPRGGLVGAIDPRTGASWFGFGLAPPPEGADHMTPEDYREHANFGYRMVFMTRRGRQTARVDRATDCSPWHIGRAVVVCFSPLSADGTHLVLSKVTVRSLNGALRWSRAVDPADDLNGVVPTSEAGIFALGGRDGGRPVFLDAGDGHVLGPGDVPDLVLACLPDPVPRTEGLKVRLRVDAEASARYARGDVREVAQLCDRHGEHMAVAEALRRGLAVPDWFGVATRLGARTPVDGWVVWMDTDGTLHGAGLQARA